MKQLALLLGLTYAAVLGAIFVHPFYGVATYYFYALLRPQVLWKWVLPGNIRWSYYLAIATIIGALRYRFFRPAALSSATPPALSCRYCKIWLLAFAGWVALSHLQALNPEVSRRFFLSFVNIVVMWVISAFVLRTARQLWILMVLAVIAISYIAIEANLLYFFQRRLDFYEYGYGRLDNNGIALIFAMCIPLTFFVWEGTRRQWRWVMPMLSLVILHALFLTWSRGAQLALFSATPVIFWRSRHKRLLAIFALALVIVAPILAGPKNRERFVAIADYQEDKSANLRIASWQAGWAIANEYPFFGVGVRNSDLISPEYGANRFTPTIHNQYLQIAADNGFIGVALYLAFLASVWLHLGRVRRSIRGRTDPQARRVMAIANGVEGGMAVFCIGALFLSLENLEFPYLLLLLGSQLPLLSAPLLSTNPVPLTSASQA